MRNKNDNASFTLAKNILNAKNRMNPNFLTKNLFKEIFFDKLLVHDASLFSDGQE